jgi:hypothetical protein
MASVGQLRAQAPHSMHPSGSLMDALLPFNKNTPWGQTVVHIPQPTHASTFNCNVVTSDRYRRIGSGVAHTVQARGNFVLVAMNAKPRADCAQHIRALKAALYFRNRAHSGIDKPIDEV